MSKAFSRAGGQRQAGESSTNLARQPANIHSESWALVSRSVGGFAQARTAMHEHMHGAAHQLRKKVETVDLFACSQAANRLEFGGVWTGGGRNGPVNNFEMINVLCRGFEKKEGQF